jgi:hypothetical protein
MLAALAAEKVLAADETPVAVLDRAVPAAPASEETADLDEGRPTAAGSPDVMIVRTAAFSQNGPAHRMIYRAR